VKEGSKVKLLLDQEIPHQINQDVLEPNVTSQILDLKEISMSILKHKSVSTAESQSDEQLICGVAGQTNIHMVTGW